MNKRLWEAISLYVAVFGATITAIIWHVPELTSGFITGTRLSSAVVPILPQIATFAGLLLALILHYKSDDL